MNSLSTLKAGDLVIISTRDRERVATVERVTATQFVADGIRFTRNGSKVGEARGAWVRTRVRVATPEQVERVQAANAYLLALAKLRRLCHQLETTWRKLDQDANRLKRTADLNLASELVRQASAVLELEQENYE